MEKQKILEEDGIFPIIIDFTGIVKFLSDKHIKRLEKNNPNLKFETIEKTKLVINMGTTLKTSEKNAELIIELGIWNRQEKLGKIYDSNGEIRLPDLSLKMPDAMFIRHELLNMIEDTDDKIVIVAPNMAMELMPKTDSLPKAQEKMERYQANGVELGWLLYPKKRKYYTYKQNQEMKENSFDVPLEDQEIMPNFKLDLNTIFEK